MALADTETSDGPKEPKEAFSESEAVQTPNVKKPFWKRVAAWKLALIGTSAMVVIVGGGVGAGVGLSGSSGTSAHVATTLGSLNNGTGNSGNTTDTPWGNYTQADWNDNTSNTTQTINNYTTLEMMGNNTWINSTTQSTIESGAAVNVTVLRSSNGTARQSTTAELEETTTTEALTTTTSTTTTTTTTARPEPTPPPTGSSTFKRTTIFLYYSSSPGETLFLRGGLSDGVRSCPTGVALADNPCVLPIQYNAISAADHFTAYREWSQNDEYLDWNGAEPRQGTRSSDGRAASGSPTVWTTDQQDANGYVSLNTYGQHYWMLDIVMDCSKTQLGWFDLKGYVARDSGGGSWEGTINQATSCGGTAGGNTQYNGGNHLAYCGKVNVFRFNDGSCTVDNFPSSKK